VSNELDDTADELYGVPLSAFTAERKRLADALKAAGSKAAAAAVSKLPRPAMSAWVVNQLWREARDDMEELLAAGARVRDGERDALDDQRAALARLRSRAAGVLAADDHAASPATIQRIVTTLQALSALGTWDPDRPGRLVGDRDPPGFDVMMGAIFDGGPASPAPTPPRGKLAAAPPPPEKVSPRDELADRRAAEKAAAETAARKAAADKAARARVRAAEKALLERAVEGMKRVVVQKEADLANANAEVEVAEAALARARNRITDAEAALALANERVHDAESALASHIAADDE
jgi:hypothetical protein